MQFLAESAIFNARSNHAMAAVEEGSELVQSGGSSTVDEVTPDSVCVRPSVKGSSLPSGSSTDAAVLSLETWLRGNSGGAHRTSIHSPTAETR